jgi:AhpC/TSA antioxidant enzyme
LRGRLDQIHQAGAELVLIGSGSVAHARHFASREAAGIRVLADPSLRTYEALGLKRSRAATLDPGSVVAGARSTLRGHVQGRLQGDPWQQGGLFAVAPGGEILFEQRNKSAGERPKIDSALATVAGPRLGSPSVRVGQARALHKQSR